MKKLTRKHFVFDTISAEYWVSCDGLNDLDADGVPMLFHEINVKNGEQITQIHSCGNGYFDLHFEDGIILHDIDSVHIKVVEN